MFVLMMSSVCVTTDMHTFCGASVVCIVHVDGRKPHQVRDNVEEFPAVDMATAIWATPKGLPVNLCRVAPTTTTPPSPSLSSSPSPSPGKGVFLHW